ncbi:MAG: hypothetical protein ACE1Y0_04100 [Nitrosopumilaceae archaeon]
MSLEKSLELFGILRNGLFQKYKIRKFSKIRRLVLRRIFVTQEILKMTKRLGQNPFEENFRVQNGKVLDLFFQQDKSSTDQNDESSIAKENALELPTILNYEEKRVYDFLNKKGNSTTYDISSGLGLYVYDAIQILQSLEKKGMALKTSER